MKGKELRGIFPILDTPFTKSGDVDFDSLQNEVRFMSEHGCHGLTLFGIAGEYYKLLEEEQDRMLRVVIDEAHRHNTPIVANVTCQSTEAAVKRAKYFEEQGADALMLLPPSMHKPGVADLVDHMLTVCDAVKIPVVLQYCPESTGLAIDAHVFADVGKRTRNGGVYYKIECKPAGAYTTTVLNLIGNLPRVFAGNAGYQFIELFDRGAIGVMPGPSMFDLYLQIYDEYISGNRSESYKLHSNVLLPMLNHIRQKPEMIIAYEKAILCRRGIIETDYCRRPGFTRDEIYDRMYEELYEMVEPYLIAGKCK